ncbi:MAG: hypothetical protein K0U34_06830 [Alphaproteobacteria bacterium]|nr:hypothetical protein [Alphaproteobacteria bacterium]
MIGDAEHLAAGQSWRFNATHGFDDARIIIGALVTLPAGGRIVCFSVTRAPTKLSDGTIAEAMISFVPMAEPAFRATVIANEGMATPPQEFSDELTAWQRDERGLTIFTVPFDGCLDRLLANQAASLIAKPAA